MLVRLLIVRTSHDSSWSSNIYEDLENEVNGVTVNLQHFQIRIRSFINYIPAKTYIKDTKGHTAFHACEKCDTTAHNVDSTTVYLNVGNKRTNAYFRSFKDLKHHNGVCPLIAIDPPADLIRKFVIHGAHVLHCGTIPRILDDSMHTYSGNRFELCAFQKIELNSRSEMINKDIPEEFQRKMRPITLH